MPGNVKTSCIRLEASRADERRVDIGAVDSVCCIRHEVRGRDLEEIGLQLELAILFSGNRSVFCNDRAIVVACVAARVTQISPVGTR